MEKPATAPWGLNISYADFEKLRAGFEPQDQDDKWRVSVTGQSASGNISILLTRVGTGKTHYVLVVKADNASSSSGCGVKIEAITWERSEGGNYISEEEAKKKVVLITRSLLRCDYDAFPKCDT